MVGFPDKPDWDVVVTGNISHIEARMLMIALTDNPLVLLEFTDA
jgi:hypothetical protein